MSWAAAGMKIKSYQDIDMRKELQKISGFVEYTSPHPDSIPNKKQACIFFSRVIYLGLFNNVKDFRFRIPTRIMCDGKTSFRDGWRLQNG